MGEKIRQIKLDDGERAGFKLKIQEQKKSKTEKNLELRVSLEETRNGALFEALGTKNADLATMLLQQLIFSLPPDLANTDKGINAVTAMLAGIAPNDELEGALAIQMVAIHNASLEMIRRASIPGQTSEDVTENIGRAVKLSRIFMQQVGALQKYRGKCSQTIKVQHVHVNDGGKAIVGDVSGGGGNE